jgi:hypothetical protein
MDDTITGLKNSLSSSPGRSISMPSTPISPDIASGRTNMASGSTSKIITIGLIVVVLALLGLNIFAYLAKGTDYIGDFISKFTQKVPSTAGDIINTSIIGTELAADVAAGTIKDAGDVLSRELDIKRKDLWETRDSGVKKAINNRDMIGINKFPQHEPKKQYTESSEDNVVQERHKPGYCYIGTDRGYRSCIKVNTRDHCESDKIFPTMDICINPSLRT